MPEPSYDDLKNKLKKDAERADNSFSISTWALSTTVLGAMIVLGYSLVTQNKGQDGKTLDPVRKDSVKTSCDSTVDHQRLFKLNL